jgi:hypothetical protein
MILNLLFNFNMNKLKIYLKNMLTIHALEKEIQSLEEVKSVTTDVSDNLNSLSAEQKRADEYLRSAIEMIVNKKGENDLNNFELQAEEGSPVSSRLSKRQFWKKVQIYLKTGVLLAAHFLGVYGIKWFSYKLISNREIISNRKY